MVQRMLRLPEVKVLSGMSRSSIYLRIAQGLFPRPIALGPRMVAFPEIEVAAVIAARIRGESDDAIRELVARLATERKKAV